MVIENIDPMFLEWAGDRVTNFIDHNLDAAFVAGASAAYAFLKNPII